MPPSTHSSFLERGKACIDCRRRKVRCDGEQPACGRCVRAGHAEDCEYQSEYGLTPSQVLEDSIAKLEARIRELEKPRAAPDVSLHEPYNAGPSGQPPVSSDAALPIVDHEIAPPIPLMQDWWQSPEPPPHIARQLVNCFASHASQFGFFLNGPRFFRSIFSSGQDQDQRARPSQGLLNAVYLIGVYVSSSDAFRAKEPEFLSRTAQHTTSNESDSNLLHRVQAEVLLAYYFICNGRSLEAMHRLNQSVSLCIAGGLHRQESTSSRNYISPPSDAIEFGERIDAVWTVLWLQKAWSLALNWPSTNFGILEDQVDIPWPLNGCDYASGQFPTNSGNNPTLKTFMYDTTTADSDLKARVKAAIYLAQTSEVVSEETCSIDLQRSLHAFCDSLPRFELLSSLPSDLLRQQLVTFTLAKVALIQLYSKSSNPTSQRAALQVAFGVVEATHRTRQLDRWMFIDPIVGTLWAIVCQVFISRLRNAQDTNNYYQHQMISTAIDMLLDIVNRFAAYCPMIRYQLTKLQDLLAQLQDLRIWFPNSSLNNALLMA